MQKCGQIYDWRSFAQGYAKPPSRASFALRLGDMVVFCGNVSSVKTRYRKLTPRTREKARLYVCVQKRSGGRVFGIPVANSFFSGLLINPKRLARP